MADQKKPVPEYPNFKTLELGIGNMFTRKGRGLIDDDLPSDLSSAKPGLYGPHQKEEPDDTNAYNKGGMVKHGSSTRVSCKSKG